MDIVGEVHSFTDEDLPPSVIAMREFINQLSSPSFELLHRIVNFQQRLFFANNLEDDAINTKN